MKAWLDLFLVMGVPMLVTIPVTALLCRYRLARQKQVSYGTMFAGPVISTTALFIAWGIHRSGWSFFTLGAWTGSRGALVPFLVGVGFLSVLCVVPALGVVIYYQRQRKNGEVQQKTSCTTQVWKAVLFSIGLYAVCCAASVVVGPQIAFYLMCMIVLGTSLWAAIDSSKLHLKRYRSGISYGPVALFLGCLLLWIVGFPWYLVMRHNIKTGTAVLK